MPTKPIKDLETALKEIDRLKTALSEGVAGYQHLDDKLAGFTTNAFRLLAIACVLSLGAIVFALTAYKDIQNIATGLDDQKTTIATLENRFSEYKKSSQTAADQLNKKFITLGTRVDNTTSAIRTAVIAINNETDGTGQKLLDSIDVAVKDNRKSSDKLQQTLSELATANNETASDIRHLSNLVTQLSDAVNDIENKTAFISANTNYGQIISTMLDTYSSQFESLKTKQSFQKLYAISTFDANFPIFLYSQYQQVFSDKFKHVEFFDSDFKKWDKNLLSTLNNCLSFVAQKTPTETVGMSNISIEFCKAKSDQTDYSNWGWDDNIITTWREFRTVLSDTKTKLLSRQEANQSLSGYLGITKGK